MILEPGVRHTSVWRPHSHARIVVSRDSEEVSWAIARAVGVDLALVHDLARLAVSVRRAGWSMTVREPCADLAALLELTGLGAALGRSGVEAIREAEGPEERFVDEVVEPGDPLP